MARRHISRHGCTAYATALFFWIELVCAAQMESMAMVSAQS
ncbi:hypothetical protein [Wielerella bovis]|nr:hypothetical protein [Wielerella bovis]